MKLLRPDQIFNDDRIISSKVHSPSRATVEYRLSDSEIRTFETKINERGIVLEGMGNSEKDLVYEHPRIKHTRNVFPDSALDGAAVGLVSIGYERDAVPKTHVEWCYSLFPESDTVFVSLLSMGKIDAIPKDPFYKGFFGYCELDAIVFTIGRGLKNYNKSDLLLKALKKLVLNPAKKHYVLFAEHWRRHLVDDETFFVVKPGEGTQCGCLDLSLSPFWCDYSARTQKYRCSCNTISFSVRDVVKDLQYSCNLNLDRSVAAWFFQIRL